MRLFYSNRNGTFGSAVVYPLGNFPISIVTGDFNGDGAQDVAVALNNSTAVPVFYNQGGTHFALTPSNTNPACGSTGDVHSYADRDSWATGHPAGRSRSRKAAPPTP